MKKLLMVLTGAALLAGCHTGNDRSKGGSEMDNNTSSQSYQQSPSNTSTNSSLSDTNNNPNPNQ